MNTQNNGAQNDTRARIVDKRKNWEARVEMEIFKRPAAEMSVYDKMVYAILCGHANRDGNAMLYVRTIAEEASCSERQVRRAFYNLEARGLLVRRAQNAPGRGQTFNIYEIYGFDSYLSDVSPCQPATPPTAGQSCHPLPASQPTPCQSVIPPETVRQAPHDSQAEPNNVFKQPLYNSSKDNNIPPTPQGAGEGKTEISKPQSQSQSQKHDTEDKEQKCMERMPTATPSQEMPCQAAPTLVMDILAVFNEVLPELPKAEALTSSRTQAIKSRINDDPARQSPDWWRRYFERVRLFPWLMGNNPNNWKATFDWLTSEDGMRKVIEGAFTQAQRQSKEYSPEELREWQKRYTDERGIVDAKALYLDWRAKTAATR